ncbi:ZIP family metal transporter [Candidatus Laterigemmans baculatus]|uniref:ZIP family metal transporter n=1 Tax=Candidatus Laterigemmans baculatus TaxID=2770505 RepID=UPI0013D92655|nr:ZIP family metal transporter [Candidatus Laterigemmans baculatus]
MWIVALLIGYCLLVAAASMAGGWLPALVRMTHLRTQLLMSFVAGLMLGISMLHLMPHAFETLGSAAWSGGSVLSGMIFMFLLLRAFHVHHHGDAPLAVDPAATIAEAPEDPALAAEEQHRHLCELEGHGHGHDDHHGHEHGHEHGHGHGHGHAGRPLGWMGLVFGLSLHTLMDGVALGASVTADAEHGDWLGLAGLGTFLAVALHKPLDAFAITSVMQTHGWSPRQRGVVNAIFALACPAGALLFWFGATQFHLDGIVLGLGLGVSAGFFICIALADLLPEVHFHDHDRGKLTAALLLGVALAVGIENLPGHQHSHGPHSHEAHDHAGHEHH